jgi:hypothetical protein
MALYDISARTRNTILNGSEFDIRHARHAGDISMARQAVDLILAWELSVREAYRTCCAGGE